MKYLIGIDPGAAGGIAVINATDGRVEKCIKMPETPQDINLALVSYYNNAIAYIEDVHAMPGNGVVSMFNFGINVGYLRMALLANAIPAHYITPSKWQKYYSFGATMKSEGKTAWKNRLKAKAQELHPYLQKDINLKTADAVLIAEYGYRQEKSIQT